VGHERALRNEPGVRRGRDVRFGVLLVGTPEHRVFFRGLRRDLLGEASGDLGVVDVPDDWRVLHGTYINSPERRGTFFVARTPKRNTELPVHPCRDHSHRLVGPSVDDLAHAFASQPVWKMTKPRPVTLDGRRAVYLEVKLPERVDPADCVDHRVSEYEAGRDGLVTEEANWRRWWILEVDGEDDLDTISAMAESIKSLGRPHSVTRRGGQGPRHRADRNAVFPRTKCSRGRTETPTFLHQALPIRGRGARSAD
jgi:hypothetical protein